MIAVIFKPTHAEGASEACLDIAATLKPLLEEVARFVSVERCQSLTAPGKLPSLRYFRDEAAVKAWRARVRHRRAPAKGPRRAVCR